MKMRVRGMILLCALFCAAPAGAGGEKAVDVPQPDPVVEAWRWQFFTEADGLASVRVNGIAQAKGAVWFATDRGVSRYDGIDWRTYTSEDGLPDDDVRSVVRGRDGALWFGAASGVCRFDGTAWEAFGADRGLPGACNGLLAAENGDIWAATDAGAARLEGSAWRVYTDADGLADSRVNGLAQHPEGAIWFATERGVTRFDGSAWQSYRKGNGLEGISVTGVYAARDGDIWAAQYGVGLSRLRDGAWTAFNAENGLPDSHVRQVLQTPDGANWALCRSGLARLDGANGSKTRSWRAYGRKALPGGLGEPCVAGVDARGAIWIAGRGARAVARFDYSGDRWTAFHLDRASGTAAGNGIGQDRDGALWFGADRGAFRYDGARWTHIPDIDGPVREIFAQPDGTLYLVGRDAGGPKILRVQGPARAQMQHGLEGVEVRTMCRTPDGTLWAGTADEGLFRWEEASASWVREGSGGLSARAPKTGRGDGIHTTAGEPPTRIAALCATSDGGLWVGGRSQALNRRLKGGLWRSYALRSPGEARALFTASDGSLWIAYGSAGGGVTRLHPNGQSQRYTVREGLIHDEVHALAEGPDNVLWAGTSGGVARFDGRTWIPLDGLREPDVRALFRARDGALWMRTASGMVLRYRNDGEGPKTTLDRAPAHVSPDGNVSFSWEGRDRWSASTAALAFSYRLDGGDWSPFAERTRTPLFALPDGPHTFEVRARDPDLNVEKSPAIHRFEVEAPTYKRPWFVLLIAALLGAIGAQTRRILMRDRALSRANVQLQELDMLKTDFFSNVSHELRTPMTAIKGYVDNMLDGIAGGLTDRQERYLTRIKANADRLTRLVNDLLDLSRIDRGRTDLLQLNMEKVQVREVVSEAVVAMHPMAEAVGLTLAFDGSDAHALADRDRLLQVVTNLVGNAIKFTDPGGEIAVTVHPDGEGRVLTTVRDTGKGIPEEALTRIFDRFYQVKGESGLQPGTGLGLPISKELVDLHGGNIWAESEMGVGSTFAFTLPEAT